MSDFSRSNRYTILNILIDHNTCVNATQRPDLGIQAVFLLVLGSRNGVVVVVSIIDVDHNTQITSGLFLSTRYSIRIILYINGGCVK